MVFSLLDLYSIQAPGVPADFTSSMRLVVASVRDESGTVRGWISDWTNGLTNPVRELLSGHLLIYQ